MRCEGSMTRPPRMTTSYLFAARSGAGKARRKVRRLTVMFGKCPTHPWLLAGIVFGVALFADELHEGVVGHELMVDAYRERLGISLRVLNRDVDLHEAEL